MLNSPAAICLDQKEKCTSRSPPPAVLAALFLIAHFTSRRVAAQTKSDQQQQQPIIAIQSGKLQGTLSSDQQIRIYRGIPYAAPPIGDLRWKAPQPLAKWNGVKPATDFAPRCMQAFLFHDMVFRDKGPSEDCLYLNVWTPANSAANSGARSGMRGAAARDAAPSELHNAKLPVMVWIYGGGFQGGSTSEPRQDGEQLAHKGVIVVSMNYRLGIFGFFAHPHLTAESPNHASGNYGLLDQLAALQWVHDNIAAFGGDPDNVTIFGESAGSFSVCALMASPLTKGLVHKAIGESGAFFSDTLSAISRSETEQRNAIFVEELHIKSIGDLRKVSAERLLAVAVQHKDEEHFRPIIDGYFLPAAPADIFARGEQLHIPLLAGWNRDEGSANAFFDHGKLEPTKENFAAKLRQQFGQSAPEAAKLFPSNTPAEMENSAGLLSTAQWIALGTYKWIEAHAKTGASPVYRYRFDAAPPRSGEDYERDPNNPNWTVPEKITPNTLAYHSAEIEFVFGALPSKNAENWRPSRLRPQQRHAHLLDQLRQVRQPQHPSHNRPHRTRSHPQPRPHQARRIRLTPLGPSTPTTPTPSCTSTQHPPPNPTNTTPNTNS